MSQSARERASKLLQGLIGREPAAPVGPYAEPVNTSDRLHFLAIVAAFVFVVILAVAVTQFDQLSIRFREIPEDVINIDNGIPPATSTP